MDLRELMLATTTLMSPSTNESSLLLIVLLTGVLLLFCGAILPISKMLRIKLTPRTVRRVRRTMALSFLGGAAKALGSAVVLALIWWAQQNFWLY
ncbi:hypothetical protein ACFWVP_18245 [Streptomyces sp. NPDC058637]|uniref:hypothetical protein n=1 Tax=Streptomyces sp. NPDC058637 TaxID=3346569 RepID=UPI003657458D